MPFVMDSERINHLIQQREMEWQKYKVICKPKMLDEFP